MKGRAHRRYMEEKHLKKRLERVVFLNYFWRRYKDINGNKHAKPIISNLLGDPIYSKLKSTTTDKWGSKRKIKYSPNRSKEWYRDNKKLETREFRRRELHRILKESGIK